MASKTARGLSRIGILLSIIWIILVGGVALHEKQDKRPMCMAVQDEVRSCHHYFYKWMKPEAGARNRHADDEDDNSDEAEDNHISLNLGKLRLNLETAAPRVYRLDEQAFATLLLSPLAAIWLLALGIGWCVAGFRERK